MNLSNTGDFWVVEYSTQQKAFNIDSLARILAVNYKMVKEGENNGYLVFGIFRTIQEANTACDKMMQEQEALCQRETDTGR